jgi:hypothetical protein
LRQDWFLKNAKTLNSYFDKYRNFNENVTFLPNSRKDKYEKKSTKAQEIFQEL